jgi:putative Mn2+ efflux pump MntP
MFELFVMAAALSMDAFAASICKGLALGKTGWRESAKAGLWFGGFQALMPLIGYLLGTQFQHYIVSIDHWIAFALLLLIGGNMVKESFSKGGGEEDKTGASMAAGPMFFLAVATSIDALAVGVTLAFLQVSIVPSVCFIGATTFVFSAAGIKLGSLFGKKHKSIAELFGGVVLILIGTKILIEHLLEG